MGRIFPETSAKFTLLKPRLSGPAFFALKVAHYDRTVAGHPADFTVPVQGDGNFPPAGSLSALKVVGLPSCFLKLPSAALTNSAKMGS